MSLKAFAAAQLRQPSGTVGRVVVSRLLNRLNSASNQLVLHNLRLQPNDSVLEVGFGGGDMLARLGATVVEGSIAGVDISQEMVEVCRKRLGRLIERGRLDLRCASVEALPYPDNHFTKACAINTIYFWPDTTQGLNELKRVLRPASTLCIGFADARSLQTLAPYGFSLFEPREMEWALELAGFTHIALEKRTDWRGDFYCASAVA